MDVFSIAFTGSEYGGSVRGHTAGLTVLCPLTDRWTSRASGVASVILRTAAQHSRGHRFLSDSDTVVLSVETMSTFGAIWKPYSRSIDLEHFDGFHSRFWVTIVIPANGDIFFHVAWTVLSETFDVVFPADTLAKR